MAQKRMFSLQIVDSDAFLEMPVSARLLYFDLGMRADDDGFVDSSKKIMKFTGASDDDLKVLLTKRFLLACDKGVIVIKHWKINNYIAKDRYNPTKYIEQKNKLFIKQNGSYTDCIQSVDIVSTQTRLGKIRLDKKHSENFLKLKKYLEESEKQIHSPEKFLDSLVLKYGKKLVDKLLVENIGLADWTKFLDVWKNEKTNIQSRN